MKRYVILALCLVLTAAVLAGCGCTKQKMDDKNTSAPTVLPTNEEVWDNTTANTSRPTTPSTAATEPSATIDRGNGALEDTGSGMDGTDGGTGSNGGTGTNGSAGTGETGSTTAGEDAMTGRSRQAMPNAR